MSRFRAALTLLSGCGFLILLTVTACSNGEAPSAPTGGGDDAPGQATGPGGDGLGGNTDGSQNRPPIVFCSGAGGECAEGQTCIEGTCAATCERAFNRCGAELLTCCDDGAEVCIDNACAATSGECEFTEECAPGAYCEPTLNTCIPRPTRETICVFRPPVGEFSPEPGCLWRSEDTVLPAYDDVVMAPAVANLTDDNGDGVTDARDTPDIVFVSFNREVDGCCTPNGVLRIASGACNEGRLTTLATLGGGASRPVPRIGGGEWTGWIGNSTGIVLANLDPDTEPSERAPEIVATYRDGGTIAFKRTSADGSAWAVMWENTTYLTNNHRNTGGAQPAAADLDGDGRPEIIIGNVVLNGQTGELVWDGRLTPGTTAAANRGIGNNAFLGPVSTVADLDLDGVPEVIAGNTVYDGVTGAERATFTFTTFNGDCDPRGRPCDGFNGVGNFDDDPEGEIVIVRQGEVFVLDYAVEGDTATLTELHRAQLPQVGAGERNEGGPPTIADFDGDGRPEIGTAGATYYVVFDFDDFTCPNPPLRDDRNNVILCDESKHIRWATRNNDASSRATASSVFDFEGDGPAEVVYADETSFMILDGRTGQVLFRDPTHRSNTRLEMPIVADVNNDGKSEVIIAAAVNNGTGGLTIWEDADNNWVRTRRIWNQHSYHVTNISESGQVPRYETPNWSNGRLNNFRQNIQPDGVFDAPDLFIESMQSLPCISSGALRVVALIGNKGSVGVAAGVPVTVTATVDGETFPVGVLNTTQILLPGQSQRLGFDWVFPPDTDLRSVVFNAEADRAEDGSSIYNECDETNNTYQSEPIEGCVVTGLI